MFKGKGFLGTGATLGADLNLLLFSTAACPTDADRFPLCPAQTIPDP